MNDVRRIEAIDFPRGLGGVIAGLREARHAWREAHARNAERGVAFPSRRALTRIMRELGVREDERIAGFVHIGTATERPGDRPRPLLDDVAVEYGADSIGALAP